jgi:hypothetical protein
MTTDPRPHYAPCFFCHSSDGLDACDNDFTSEVWIECRACGMRGPPRLLASQAREAWNQLMGQTPHPEEMPLSTLRRVWDQVPPEDHVGFLVERLTAQEWRALTQAYATRAEGPC